MSNLDRLRAAMAAQNIPALIVSDIPNVSWATGFTGTAGIAIVTATDGRFLTDSRYTLQASEQVTELPTYWFQNPVSSDEFLARHVMEMGISRIGFEASSVTYANYERWKNRLTGIELFGAPDLFQPLRMVKSASEIDRIRQACGIADACFDHVLRMIQPGVTEYDINLEIEFFIRRQGAALAFEPIVVSGERSARPHGKASEKKLAIGDFVTMDFGAKVDGYCSDITRTVVVGEATPRHQEIYDQVLQAEKASIAAIKPGARAADVDGLARKILDEKELAQYFGHGLGHGLGALVHDAGRMNPTSDNVFEAGQVWTVEPGVYIPGFGGVRIEDDVLVTENGVEILTKSNKELLVTPA